MFKTSSAKYYHENKERLQKKLKLFELYSNKYYRTRKMLHYNYKKTILTLKT